MDPWACRAIWYDHVTHHPHAFNIETGGDGGLPTWWRNVLTFYALLVETYLQFLLPGMDPSGWSSLQLNGCVCTYRALSENIYQVLQLNVD